MNEPEPSTTTKPTRRKNVVSVELTDEQMAQAVVLGLDPDRFVSAAVTAHASCVRRAINDAVVAKPA